MRGGGSEKTRGKSPSLKECLTVLCGSEVEIRTEMSIKHWPGISVGASYGYTRVVG